MYKPDRKFPKSSVVIAVACAFLMAGFVIFYATADMQQRFAQAVVAIMVLLSPVCIVMFYSSVKDCLVWSKSQKVMQSGKDGVCHISDFQTIHYNKRHWDVSYSLIVAYEDNGIEKTYKTRYEFSKEEYEYLSKLKQIRCKFYGNLFIITEKIPDKVYENTTIYGKEDSKFRRVFITVWQIIGYIGVALELAGIVATIITQVNLYLIIGTICAFAPNLICGIIFGLHFLITGG